MSVSREGGWSTLETVHPRHEFSRYAVPTGGSNEIRLVFAGEHNVRIPGRLTVSSEVTPSWLTLESAAHSHQGDVESAVGSVGGGTTTLGDSQKLTLAFGATSVPSGKIRNFFLQAKRGDGGSSEEALDRDAVVPVGATFEYSLGSARPNPTRGTVRIDYSLAKPSHVSLRIYNVAGRLVRDLVGESQRPG